MKKYVVSVFAALALSAGMLTAVHAATTANDFNVTVTLTSQCQATNSATQTVAFGTYTAFQTTVQTAPAVNLTYRCTRGYAPISVAFDAVDANSVGARLKLTSRAR